MSKPAGPSWADRYRQAAERCLALQAAEPDGLVQHALGTVAAQFTRDMLDHLDAQAKGRPT